MGKKLLSGFISLIFIGAGASSALALQSGGVEFGDLETGSVIGQKFSQLEVDAEFTAMQIGDEKIWYPPTNFVNLVARGSEPVLLKVSNNTNSEHGFDLSADSRFAAPTSMHIQIVLKPGETKYIGIPTSDLTYVTAAGLLVYKCHLHPNHLGGKLMILKK